KPLDILREIQTKYKAPKLENMPPFTGGFVGYFAYSMIKYAEPKLKIKQGEFNDFDMMLFDKVIAFDHQRQKIYIIANIKTDNVAENYKKAIDELEAISKLIYDNSPVSEQSSDKNIKFTCNIKKEEYCNIVKKAKEYIRDGDIFQAVLSRKFSSPYKSNLINAYRILRTTNPSPYLVYMKIDEDELICSSPETLIKLNNGRLTTFPVAGSRPRGKTSQEDLDLEKELLADEKELSEHNMLVDLGRNDLGRISKFSSVEVTEYMMIHRYSKIMHICSQVESDILENCDGYSAIEAVLPAGTLSGAPKIRACEIIEELEKEPRGIYGGALGYFDFTGNMDTCIAIRMAVKKGDNVYVQAGGGVVADSVPEKEYEESGNKALAIINAIIEVREAFEE
ncbi:MAG: anthranilate synthase component I family protein, partial [Bacillota bacterium]|nr:anthranilate synthase component I family protein [Bacillota bacterium]